MQGLEAKRLQHRALREKPDQPHRAEHRPGAYPAQCHHHRHHHQNDHIHRQDVEIIGHIGEGEKTHKLRPRILEKLPEVQRPDIGLVEGAEVIERRKQRRGGKEQRDMRPVDLPDAVAHARRAKGPARPVKRPAKRDGRGHARAEYENLGRVRKTPARRNPAGEEIARGVGGEDDEHRQPAKEIQPDIARARHRGGCRFLGLAMCHGRIGNTRHRGVGSLQIVSRVHSAGRRSAPVQPPRAASIRSRRVAA